MTRFDLIDIFKSDDYSPAKKLRKLMEYLRPPGAPSSCWA
jgi:hypothetical protein